MFTLRGHLCVAILCLSLPASGGIAQTPNLVPMHQENRVAQGADLGPRTLLTGHVPRWARAENLTATPVDPTQPLRLTIVMSRAPAVQDAFEQLLAEQQDPTSPHYHQWLTPQQLGSLYGPTQTDVDAVTSWAASQSLHLQSVAPNHLFLEFTGTVGETAGAFRTSFGYFTLNGTARLSVESEPMVPSALAPVIAAVRGLADIPEAPQVHAESVAVQPLYTNGSANTTHYLTPNDFATIFDLSSIYSAGNTGAAIGSTPQHIAIIDESDLVTQDIADYAAKVGIASYTLHTIYPAAVDPGLGSSQDETTLDAMRTIGTAPGAVSDLLIVGSNNGGLYTAASYNMNTLLDPVMTMSWGSCETSSSTAIVTTWDSLYAIGAAEGITSFVSAGDSGAAGCDAHGGAPPVTTQLLAINAFCSSSYVTCVGGTEFNDTANPSLYWSATNGTGLASALSYIPEGAWNEPTTSTGTEEIDATGGGFSLIIAKPVWQTGTGVPADSARDTPDISFPSSGHDGYYGCYNLNCESGHFEYFYGTSAAAPGMAGVQALLNTHAGKSQGNINPLLYKLAGTSAASRIFHDTTIASSGVTSCSPAVPSMCNNSTPSYTALTGGLSGYLLQTGYDEVTGLGSLDVSNFLEAAVSVATTLTLRASSTTANTTQTLTFTATLNPASTSVASPTGTVQFYANGIAFGSPVTLSNNVATSVPQAFAPAGTYGVTAVYSGDAYYSGSNATAVSITTTLLGYTLTPNSQSLSFTSGATSGNAATVTLTSINGFAGTVAMGCSMSSSSAAFQPSCTIAPGSAVLTSAGTATASVSITSTAAQRQLAAPSPGKEAGFAASILAALMLLLLPWPRRAPKGLFLAMIACVGVMCVTGCGGSNTSSSNTGAITRSSAGSYTVTVTGSAPGTTSVAATFNLTIN
jgi:pseudomonalisin